MTDRLIDADYLRSFFGIPVGPEGDAEVRELLPKLIKIEYQNGQDICAIDTEPDGMYFLESGTAVVLDRDGQQINLLHEGQYFGEYAVLSGGRRLSTVRSLGRTIVYLIGCDDMMEVLRRHPATYGEFMKRVYAQVSNKHKALLRLSRMHRGILRDPGNAVPLPPKKMLLRYGAVALLFLLSALFIPAGTAAPVFVLPLLLMLVYALITRQTLESLIVAALYAALLFGRSGITVTFTDSFLKTFSDPDNVSTVFIMALIGAFAELVEASGAVTALKKLVDRRCRSPRGVKLAIFLIHFITGIDDGLNALCAAKSTNAAAEKHRVSCEDRAALLSFLPVAVCSFIPISLWSVFVIGSIKPTADRTGLALFVRAIPFNFFPIIVVLAMLLFCFDRLPLTKHMKLAHQRVRDGGQLWPEGSERYLLEDEGAVWGRSWDLLLPIIVLAAASVTLRSIFSHSFAVDNACGLVAALVFMFFLYCGRRLMSPELFMEHLVSGIQSMALPILLYLLSMCLAALLDEETMVVYFDNAVSVLKPVAPLLPAALFLTSTLFAFALGSSWAMYAIAFPVATRLAVSVGIHVPLIVGVVCAAGMAGEKLCVFTSDDVYVAGSIGCAPKSVLSIRMSYSIAFSLISLLLYLAAGFLIR